MKHKLEHSKTAKITDDSGATDVCILIDDIPHIGFPKKKYLGYLAWYVSNTDFRIQIYLKGKTIKNEYNSFEKWKSILKIIRKQV